jgi:hypothetical protein
MVLAVQLIQRTVQIKSIVRSLVILEVLIQLSLKLRNPYNSWIRWQHDLPTISRYFRLVLGNNPTLIHSILPHTYSLSLVFLLI